jgi:hypothetical protein
MPENQKISPVKILLAIVGAIVLTAIASKLTTSENAKPVKLQNLPKDW